MTSIKTEPTSIFTEYINLTQEYQVKYGPRTILLMQVGAFFEVYGLKDNEGIIHKTHIAEFAQLSNLNISEKKATYGEYQVVMAGFRDYTLEKYLQKITEGGYSAVVYVQEKDGKNITRTFHSVHSAGTYISYETDMSPQITNNIMCVWIDKYKPFTMSDKRLNKEQIIYGVAVANIFTGQSYLFEYQTAYYMNPTTFDELERYVSIYSPSEVVFISSFDETVTNTIIQYSGIKSNIIHRLDINDLSNEKIQNCTKQKYIQHILSVFYGEEAYQICSEFNNHTFATQAFCYLLNFIQEHNPDLVRKIALPTFNNTSDRLILANHTLKQLNIIDDNSSDGLSCGKKSSVLSFLHRCCSPMGKRLFQTQLLNPSYNESWLNEEYNMIDQMLVPENYAMVAPIRKQLVQIRDLEKICRQLVMQKIYPSSIYHLYQSVRQIQQINVCMYENTDISRYLCSGYVDPVMEANDSKQNPYFHYIDSICSKIVEFIESQIQVEMCKTATSDQTFEYNIINLGISASLDNVLLKHQENTKNFSDIHEYFNTMMRNHEGNSTECEYVKVHDTEKSGSSLQITKKRGVLLKSILSILVKQSPEIQINHNLKIQISDIKLVSASTSLDEINIPILSRICKDISLSKDNLNAEITKAYRGFLLLLEQKWFQELEQLSKYVAKIDVLQTKAYLATELHYCRPEIVSESDHAFVSTVGLRHCLIEHLQQNELYVVNDVELNSRSKSWPKSGILLYGTNAVGKTSLIRALGISVIMAQSGMFVPCTKFTYKPYTAIFSRILGNDNIFKGLSTFAVEMSELRIILKMADKNSLILGDELCSGTETESALSIFMAGLIDLYKKQSSFIFATHFHEIIQYDEMADLQNIRIMHMAVHYDRAIDGLVYDRKLRDGPGNRMYGLEVCKSLYLPDEFLEKAYSIRNKYHPETKGELGHSTTTYNAKKIRGICEMCKINISEEIHHLQQQKEADENGFIDTFHKNHPANLMAVCEACHDKFHAVAELESVKIAEDSNITTDITSKRKVVRKKTTKGYKIDGLV